MSDAPAEVEILVVYTNTDLTEGKGYPVAIGWTRSKSAAKRLAHKKGVMGSDAEVRHTRAFQINRTVFAPVFISEPTEADLESDRLATEADEARAAARAAGLSEAQIAALRRGT